jgi:hypothetical protein
VSNIHITSLSLPSSDISPASGQVVLTMHSITIALSADFHYRKHSWPHVSGSGSADITISKSSISFCAFTIPSICQIFLTPANCSRVGVARQCRAPHCPCKGSGHQFSRYFCESARFGEVCCFNIWLNLQLALQPHLATLSGKYQG